MNALTPNVVAEDAHEALAVAIVSNDLSKLTPPQRVTHYNAVCQSAGLNPLTRPFEYLTLNGKMVLYATKNCTDQLRSSRRVSIEVTRREVADGLVIVTARAKLPDGREDEDVGAVPLPANGEARANAMMKALTKAKRRVTLSICGLSYLDESELDTVRDAAPIPLARGPVVDQAPAAPAPRPSYIAVTADGEAEDHDTPEAWRGACLDAIAAAHDAETLARWWAANVEHARAVAKGGGREAAMAVKNAVDARGAMLAAGDAAEPSADDDAGTIADARQGELA